MSSLSEIEYHNPKEESAWMDYTCGHCGRDVVGFRIATTPYSEWLLCPKCSCGSVYVCDPLFDDTGTFYPSVEYGLHVDGLPLDIDRAYEEARRATSASAYIGTEVLCRNILMHVAVEKGAEEGESFASYIQFLEDQGYLSPDMKKWVDLIRQHGNTATHTIDPPDAERAKITLAFTAELLRVVYEMDYLAKKIRKEAKASE